MIGLMDDDNLRDAIEEARECVRHSRDLSGGRFLELHAMTADEDAGITLATLRVLLEMAESRREPSDEEQYGALAAARHFVQTNTGRDVGDVVALPFATMEGRSAMTLDQVRVLHDMARGHYEGREGVIRLSCEQVKDLFTWLVRPSGAAALGSVTVEAEDGGGIMIRTDPRRT